MSLFRKSKPGNPDQATLAERVRQDNHATQQAIGQIAITPPKTEPDANKDHTQEVATKSYADEVRGRINAMDTAQHDLLKAAVDRGIPQDQLPELVADAMNAGQIPKILPAMTFKGSGQQLLLLDGEVTPDVIGVMAKMDDMNGSAAPNFHYAIGLNEMPETFRIEVTPLLPQVDRGEPVDTEMLAKIDAHMGVPPAQA